MTETDEASSQVRLNMARCAAVALTVGGALIALVTLAWALARYAQLSHAGEFSWVGFWQTTAWLAAALAAGLFLWGLAEILRRIDSALAAPRPAHQGTLADATLYGMPFRPEPSARTAEVTSAALQELVTLMREVRDISLLSERERAARLQVQGQALVRQLQTAVPALLQEHKWPEARRRVHQARERFPTFPVWDELEQQIEAMRATVESRDVENVTRQVNDLAALGAWERAMGVVADLLERHPASPAAQELTRRVRLQRDKADAEQRARLMAQAQQAVSRREWSQALGLANDIVRRFPKSAEAEALRQQLPILAENAEIQARHQMEHEFREFVKQHRYTDALGLARELIARYPSSPQAEFLHEQLPRLEQKVRRG